MTSNYIWVLGLFVSVVAGAFLWISHMNSFATPKDTGDTRDADTQTASKPAATEHRYQAMPSLSPARQSAEIVIVDHEQIVVIEEQTIVSQEMEPIPDQPDHEDVEMSLKLADQLQVIGDYEGVTDYAKLVLDDSKASIRQKIRAQALLRRDNSF